MVSYFVSCFLYCLLRSENHLELNEDESKNEDKPKNEDDLENEANTLHYTFRFLNFKAFQLLVGFVYVVASQIFIMFEKYEKCEACMKMPS